MFSLRWRYLALVVPVGLFLLWRAPEDPLPEPLPEPQAAEPGLQGVPLEQVRAALPDNLYWQQQALQDGAFERNLVFGAIQSGNASEEDIFSYYEEREQISRDYVAFAEYVLLHHGEQLAERDRGLLELAREMNEKRLAQLPVELERALARKSQQDEARGAWREHATREGGP